MGVIIYFRDGHNADIKRAEKVQYEYVTIERPGSTATQEPMLNCLDDCEKVIAQFRLVEIIGHQIYDQ